MIIYKCDVCQKEYHKQCGMTLVGKYHTNQSISVQICDGCFFNIFKNNKEVRKIVFPGENDNNPDF